MEVIINADDFGIDYDRDIGIFYGVLRGCITSVSVVVTNKIGRFRKILIAIIKKKASIGLHINLTDNPLIMYNASDLYAIEYNFSKTKYTFWKNALENNIFLDKIRNEIEKQTFKFINEYGFTPEHIDGHNHCNIFNKNINFLFERIANKYGVHLRIPYEKISHDDVELLLNNEYFKDLNIKKQNSKIEYILNNYNYFSNYDILLYNALCKEFKFYDEIDFLGSIYGYIRKPQTLYTQLIRRSNENVIQVMCHPGFYIPYANHNTKFSNKERFFELRSLIKTRKKLLKYTDIKLTTFKSIKK